MRVLHILNDVTDRGNGIVNTAVDLAMEQVRAGAIVTVVSLGGGYKPLLERAGIAHITLDQSRRITQMLRAVPRFGRILREFRPDVVHAHMRTGLLLAWFWRRFSHFALVGHVHNVHDRESVMMGLADRVIAVSNSVATTMQRQGIPARKIRVVLNRILGSRRLPDRSMIDPALLQHPAIVTVGGMTPRKGIEELIAAFEPIGRDFPDAHLYLVGDGPERAQFEQQARRSPHAGRIHFEGFQAVPQSYMLSADVFVLASRRESFGLVLTEAREAGCAIVATDVDGIAEALDGGQAGVLVPARNVAALAGAIGHMLRDEEDRNQWRNRAQQGIEAYSVHRMAEDVQQIYQELVFDWRWRDASNMVRVNGS